MSFSFGFGGDDIEADEEADDLARQIDQCTIKESSVLVPPKPHTLEEMLSSLPSQLSYNFLRISRPSGIVGDAADANGTDSIQQHIDIVRRSVFDIRAQLMAEANPEENDNDNLLAGLERGDLSSGVYEGGFKTWECAIDLAGLVSTISINQNMHIIELGAGSAIPSLVLLQKALQRSSHETKQRVTFTLCDYNEDVLQLATVPNLLLNQQVQSQKNSSDEPNGDYDLEDVDEVRSTEALKAFDSNSISFNLISGAWGEQFLQLLADSTDLKQKDTETLILASETIYSPASTRSFAETVVQLLRQTQSGNSKAWVAAKKLYFGVGGGVEDFDREVTARGGKLKTLLDIKDAGVARVILEITI